MTSRRNMLGGLAAGLAAATLVRGFPAIAQARPLRIGALISEKDADGVDELIQPYDAQIRLQVELRTANDGGSPAPGAEAALKLVRDDGCEALVTGFIIAIRAYMERTLQQANLNIPVIHACQTEGTYCGRIAHLGTTTVQAIN